MSGDDFSGDAAQYAELAGEINTPSSDPLAEIMGGTIEHEPLDERQVQEGIARQNAAHARAAQQGPREWQQEQLQGVPNVEEDPIGHFGHRAAVAEQMLQAVATSQLGRDWWDQVDHSERQAKADLSDYQEAVEHLEVNRWNELQRMFPDERLRQMGYRDPQQARMAMLNQDRIAVAKAAMDQGLSPAHVYYQLAQQRGYQSQRHISPTEGKRLANMYDRFAGSGDERAGQTFDQWWDQAAARGLL